MKQNIVPISSVEQEVPSLTAWGECVGKIVDVADSNITLEVVKQISIPISADLLIKWKKLIQKGKHVGILALDDGSIRIRSVSSC
jgi:hypothetical protein